MDDYMTVGQIAEKLQWPQSKVRALFGDQADLQVGRIKLFKPEGVKAFLRGYLSPELEFLGTLSPDQSYDSVIQADAPASGDGV